MRPVAVACLTVLAALIEAVCAVRDFALVTCVRACSAQTKAVAWFLQIWNQIPTLHPMVGGEAWTDHRKLESDRIPVRRRHQVRNE